MAGGAEGLCTVSSSSSSLVKSSLYEIPFLLVSFKGSRFLGSSQTNCVLSEDGCVVWSR